MGLSRPPVAQRGRGWRMTFCLSPPKGGAQMGTKKNLLPSNVILETNWQTVVGCSLAIVGKSLLASGGGVQRKQ